MQENPAPSTPDRLGIIVASAWTEPSHCENFLHKFWSKEGEGQKEIDRDR